MKIEYMKPEDLIPYERNAKKHPQEQIDQIKESIRQFGFNDPIAIGADGVVIEGHGRLIAAKELKMKTIPVFRLDKLSEEERRGYMLAHNQLTMNSGWDPELLTLELDSIQGLDMNAFGFDLEEADWFEQRQRYDNDDENESEEYRQFREKFQQPKTTDDCYTPDGIYEVIADWVADQYEIKREDMVRPFYPGGDYEKQKYKENEVVVDNPPFSILAEIVRFYCDKGIRFFLFAPTLTLFSSSSCTLATCIAANVSITYENDAVVNKSFVTNLEPEEIRAKTAPDLYQLVKEEDERIRSENHAELPKYHYPDEVVTAAMAGRWSKYGIEWQLLKADSITINALDEQKAAGKAIYGKGLLLSERAAAERAAAERAAAERWQLSEREQKIVKELGA